jgi:hypothetical protein
MNELLKAYLGFFGLHRPTFQQAAAPGMYAKYIISTGERLWRWRSNANDQLGIEAPVIESYGYSARRPFSRYEVSSVIETARFCSQQRPPLPSQHRNDSQGPFRFR